MKWNRDTTLIAYYDECYRIHRHTGRSEKTVADFRIALNRFRIFLQETNRIPADRDPTMHELTDDNLADFLAWVVASPAAPETANKYAASIKAIWRYAKRRKVIDHLPDVDPLPTPKHARKTWTPEQFNRILNVAKKQRGFIGPVPAGTFWSALLMVITNTASRITAVMKLRMSDLEFDRSIIVLRHGNVKDNSDLRLPMLPATAEAIQEMKKFLRFMPDGDDPFGADRRLFCAWPFDENGDSWSTLRNHYKQILTQAGLTSKRQDLFHCLRAYTVTRITKTYGIKAAQSYCDHSSEAVTAAYVDRDQAGMSLDMSEVLPQFSLQEPPVTPPPTSTPPSPALAESRDEEPIETRPRFRVFHGDESIAG